MACHMLMWLPRCRQSQTDIDEHAKIKIRSDTRSDSDVVMASPTARDMLPADLTKQAVTCT